MKIVRIAALLAFLFAPRSTAALDCAHALDSEALFPFVHDLGTGVATRLTYAFDTVAADMRVSGDRVVWRDSREGLPHQIWMHER